MSEFAIFPAGVPAHIEASVGTTAWAPGAALILVVGFDGSVEAERALDAAVEIVYQRHGRLEIVYVTEQSTVPASPGPIAEGNGVVDETASHLSSQVRRLLEHREERWRFHHRSGERHDQLLAAADETGDHSHPQLGNTVLIVVGNGRRTAGSVTARLLQQSSYPLVVVP